MVCLVCRGFVSYQELDARHARPAKAAKRPWPELVLIDPIDGEPVPPELRNIVAGEWKAR